MAILGMVSPQDWLERTSLLLRRRGETLERADKAYAEYHADRTEDKKRRLHLTLGAFLKEQGGFWQNVERNRKSEGLMEWVFGFTRGQDAPTNVLSKRIPETRHGVLYLWETALVETRWARIVVEGGLNIASSTLDGFFDGSTAGKAVSVASSAASKVYAPNANVVHNVTLADLRPNLGLLEKAKHYLGEQFSKLWEAIKSFVRTKISEFKEAFQRSELMRSFQQICEIGAYYVINQIITRAVPWASNALAVAKAVTETCAASLNRWEAHQLRQGFSISKGHPLLIANAIETQMNWAIGKGLWNAARASVQLAGDVASFGASVIIDVIASCLEFLAKLVLRWREGSNMNTWIGLVREVTKDRSSWENDFRGDPKEDGTPNGGPTTVGRPSIVFNTAAFTKLFEEGCKASPCVPMITLNSGICGDQMMFTQMFDDTDFNNQITQESFDKATEYWTMLKEHGREYLEGSGFTFGSSDKVAAGLMKHAIEHHKGDGGGALDKIQKVAEGVGSGGPIGSAQSVLAGG